LPHQDAVRVLAFAPNGKMLASGTVDGWIHLWDMSGPAPVQKAKFRGHGAGVNGLAFSPDGKLLASGGGDYSVTMWDLTAPPHALRPLPKSSHHSIGVAISADGKLLASAQDTYVRVVDLEGNVNLPPRGRGSSWQNGGVRAVAFTPDSKKIAAADWEGWI